MSTTVQSCSLSKAINYQNYDVVERFTQLYDVSFDEANDIFLETKKWLWLADQPKSHMITIIEPLLIIDEMWHNFILFTPEYTDYCLDCYGCYIHHAPTTQREKDNRQRQFREDPTRAREEQMQKLLQQCAFISQMLGATTLLKWFVEYPERYNEVFFNHHRKDVSLSYSPPPALQALATHLKTGRIRIAKPD
ncbi:MAG: hypothetical protein AB1589_36035 [Cyanobacteriota bacterium]